MIRFFRYLRQSLTHKDKTSKYIKYAIGEIVLVVIGILIALQINNWNEHRKSNDSLNTIYSLVKEDLKSDIKEITYILEITKPKQVIMDKILDGNMTETEFRNCEICLSLLNGYPDWAVDLRGYNLLNNYLTNDHPNQNPLQVKITQFYTTYLEEFRGDDKIRSENLINNLFEFQKNTNWYADMVTDRSYEGYIEYALQSQDFKNRVATYYILHYTIYIPLLEGFIKEAQNIIEEIDQKLNSYV
jgi:Family of unknown function (DUF6090)